MTISRRVSSIRFGTVSVILAGTKFTLSLTLSDLHFCPKEDEILQSGNECKIKVGVNAVGDAFAA